MLTGARWLYIVPGNLVGISMSMLVYCSSHLLASPRISSHLLAPEILLSGICY
jgi:hypothetical protein